MVSLEAMLQKGTLQKGTLQLGTLHQTWELLEARAARFRNQTDKIEEPKRYDLLRMKNSR